MNMLDRYLKGRAERLQRWRIMPDTNNVVSQCLTLLRIATVMASFYLKFKLRDLAHSVLSRLPDRAH